MLTYAYDLKKSYFTKQQTYIYIYMHTSLQRQQVSLKRIDFKGTPSCHCRTFCNELDPGRLKRKIVLHTERRNKTKTKCKNDTTRLQDTDK